MPPRPSAGCGGLGGAGTASADGRGAARRGDGAAEAGREPGAHPARGSAEDRAGSPPLVTTESPPLPAPRLGAAVGGGREAEGRGAGGQEGAAGAPRSSGRAAPGRAPSPAPAAPTRRGSRLFALGLSGAEIPFRFCE